MTRRPLIHLAAAGALAAAALGAYAAWFLALQAADARADELAAEIARIEREDAAIASATDVAAALAADEAALASYFVSRDGIVQFLEELERAGDEAGSLVEVASVAPGTGAAKDRVTLALRITGSFEGVMRTLGAFEYGPRDMRIESLALDSSREEEGSTWTAAAIFVAGLLPEAEAPPAP